MNNSNIDNNNSMSTPCTTITTSSTSSSSPQSSQSIAQLRLNRISVGVCCLEKKSCATPMKNVLSRLKQNLSQLLRDPNAISSTSSSSSNSDANTNIDTDVDIVVFTNDQLFNADVSQWPVVDAIIVIFSEGFPIEKASKYLELHPSVFSVNDVDMQNVIRNRVQTYKVLHDANIPTPTVLIPESADDIKEDIDNDTICINNITLHKPFVEKPVDADDHNVRIYYPTVMTSSPSPSGVAGVYSEGDDSSNNSPNRVNGVCELFRKKANCSSRFIEGVKHIRTNGRYIYESFIKAHNPPYDIKVYAIRGGFSYAESRKAPFVDGIVERNNDGREKRAVVTLTDQERDVAERVCVAFKHSICGFDMLRYEGGFVVFDVGGWSFVKDSEYYYDECGKRLAKIVLEGVLMTKQAQQCYCKQQQQ